MPATLPTDWYVRCKATQATWNTTAVTARDAFLTAQGQAINATTTTQWAAVVAAVNALLAGLGITGTQEFYLQVSGSDPGGSQPHPLISITVQKV